MIRKMLVSALAFGALTVASAQNNPVIKGRFADPEVLYSNKTHKFYIYPTTDGVQGWGGDVFHCFSSEDLATWTDEGVIIDLKKDVPWAESRAWAPCIEEKKQKDGSYKYYYYFTAETKIGVAVADDPAGPFKELGEPLISERPVGAKGGQCIDPDVFTDPVSGKTYLYWGNGFMAVSELDASMTKIVPNSTHEIIHRSGVYREGTYVFYRKGKYYFLWSQDDTRSPNYSVRYVISDSPTSIPDPATSTVILHKDPEQGIYGTGHNSILNIPGTDIWYIVYHRFWRPGGIEMGSDAGFNREVCIDRIYFNEDGTIREVVPTK